MCRARERHKLNWLDGFHLFYLNLDPWSFALGFKLLSDMKFVSFMPLERSFLSFMTSKLRGASD